MIWLAKQEVTHSLSYALGTQAMTEALRVGTPEVGWAYFASKPGRRHRPLRRCRRPAVANRHSSHIVAHMHYAYTLEC